TLTEVQKRKICLVQHTLIRRQESKLNHFIHVPSQKWIQLIGKDYRQWIDYLVDLGELEINERYSNQSNKDRNAFTKSYLIPGTTKHDPSSKFCLSKIQKQKIPTYHDKSELTDDLTKHVFECLNVLTIKEQLNDITHPARKAYGLEDCKKMYRGCYNVKYGTNSKRLGHVVIRMVKEARKNLIFKYPQTKLISCDITSCFPNLLPCWMSNSAEKKRYLKNLKGDFYQNLMDQIGTKKSRNQVKKDVVTYLCDSSHKSATQVAKWFTKHCPTFSEWKLKQNDMALILQNKEAEIINTLGQHCVKKRIWFVPMYDGFLCKLIDQNILTPKCESIFKNIVGHTPKITSSDLV
ncbi:hypothetical protein OAM01_01355, partial [bacterium]|nr:hypothetical protein [bacterium]